MSTMFESPCNIALVSLFLNYTFTLTAHSTDLWKKPGKEIIVSNF